MHFEISDVVRRPLEKVFNTYRDNLVDLVPHIPNVKRIEVLEREEEDKKVKLTNKWYGEKEIPKVVRKFVKKDEVTWLDCAEWVEGEKVCNWEIEPVFFKDYVKAKGQNRFISDGNYTKVEITGDLWIDLSKHPKVPKFLIKTVVKQIERFILVLIKPNLTAVNRGLEKYIKP